MGEVFFLVEADPHPFGDVDAFVDDRAADLGATFEDVPNEKKLLTRATGPTIDRSTLPPDMIAPVQTMLSCATPQRSFELNTNFGGGRFG